MSSDRGYIKIYRDIWDHWIWNGSGSFDEFHAWIDLIMMANHEDKKVFFDGKLQVVKAGSRITSIRKLADRWGWGKNRVATFLDTLEKDGMITRIRDSRKTILSIDKYGIYQSQKKLSRDSNGDTDEDNNGDNDRDKSGDKNRPQTNTRKHYRNTKKHKEEKPPKPPFPNQNESTQDKRNMEEKYPASEGWYDP